MPPDTPRLGRLHLYNFSLHVRTPSGYLHQYETCIRIDGVYDLWHTWTQLVNCATKATPETKLRVQLEQTPFTLD